MSLPRMFPVFALACAPGADSGTAPSTPPFAPTLGPWTAQIDGTWGGDCQLADPSTHEAPDQAWTLKAAREGFAILDAEGYWTDCTLDGHAFDCPLPVIDDDLTGSGYDLHATYTPRWTGDFADEAHLSGSYAVAATCNGTDCRLITGYGADFSFPCTAMAGLEAEAG